MLYDKCFAGSWRFVPSQKVPETWSTPHQIDMHYSPALLPQSVERRDRAWVGFSST